jgi:hypothetical protein
VAKEEEREGEGEEEREEQVTLHDFLPFDGGVAVINSD